MRAHKRLNPRHPLHNHLVVRPPSTSMPKSLHWPLASSPMGQLQHPRISLPPCTITLSCGHPLPPCQGACTDRSGHCPRHPCAKCRPRSGARVPRRWRGCHPLLAPVGGLGIRIACMAHGSGMQAGLQDCMTRWEARRCYLGRGFVLYRGCDLGSMPK